MSGTAGLTCSLSLALSRFPSISLACSLSRSLDLSTYIILLLPVPLLVFPPISFSPYLSQFLCECTRAFMCVLARVRACVCVCVCVYVYMCVCMRWWACVCVRECRETDRIAFGFCADRRVCPCTERGGGRERGQERVRRSIQKIKEERRRAVISHVSEGRS